MQQYLEVGKIVNTHGVRGEVKVIPLTDDPERFKKLKWVFIDRHTSMDKLSIEGIKFTKSLVIIKFKEINDMGSAEGLRDLYLKVDRENAVKLPKDTYFIADLIDCEVLEENGTSLGKLKEILKTGSNDVYVVENKDGKQTLIPALKSVVREISLESGKIVVSLPEGLTEDEI